MRFLKKTVKLLFALAILLLVVFNVLANHSHTKITMTCTGVFEKGPDEYIGQSETVYAVIEVSRHWVWWGDDDGSFSAQSKEYPLAMYYPHLRKLGDKSLALYLIADEKGGLEMGRYNSPAKKLTLEFGDLGLLFVGTCSGGI